ncbi:MAG: ABC transporter substrate-binding protein [Stellaceae bacterium]
MRRRSFLKLLGALALAARAAGAAVPRDVVVMARRIDDFVSLDPAEAYEFSDEEAIGNCYDHLLDYDPAHSERIFGVLARQWRVEGDGRRHRFALRREARFASGRPVTADDVAFSLRRVVLLDLTPAFVLRQFGFAKDNLSESIRVEDGALVLETASQMAPSLLYYVLTSSVAAVVEKTAALAHERGGDLGQRWLAFHSAGSGPYRLDDWQPGERYALDAVPDAWRGRARMPKVILLDVPEPATQRLLLVRGDADYARDLDKDDLAALERDPGFAFDRSLQALQTYLALNQRHPYLSRPDAVAAFKWLVDYDGIVNQLLGGTRVVQQGFVPQGLLGADDARPFRLDVARAKALLAQAGLAQGFEVSLDVTATAPWLDIALALQASFARAGVRLRIRPGDEKETLTKYRARRHEIYLGDWGSDYPDPHSNAQAFIVADDMSDKAALKTLAWRNSWSDPGLARRVQEAARESDIARRAQLYRALQRDHRQIAPFVLMFQDVAIAAHRKTITGFALGPSPDHTLYAGIVKSV